MTYHLTEKQKKFKHIFIDISNSDYIQYITKGIHNINIKKSQLEYKIIYRLVCLGYPSKTIESFFKNCASKNTYFKKNPIQKFTQSVERAKSYYSANKSLFDSECDTIINEIDYFKKLSFYERIILKKVFLIAKKVGSFDELYLSIYYISKCLNITSVSVYNNLKSIEEKKIITKIKNKTKNTPAQYRIEKNILLKSLYKYRKELTSNNQNIVDIDHSVFSRKKLGKSGYLIIKFFTDHIDTKYDSTEISEKLGISYNTVRKKINSLVEASILNMEKIQKYKKPTTVYFLSGDTLKNGNFNLLLNKLN